MKTYKIHILLIFAMAFSLVGQATEPLSKSEETSSLSPQQEGFVFINKWRSGEYIGETSGRAMSMKVYKTTGNTKILWTVEVAGDGFVRLKNVGNGKYLHCENGGLQIGEIDKGWQSAQWIIEKGDGYVRIQNKFNKKYINNQNEILDISDIKKSWDSAWWKMRTP